MTARAGLITAVLLARAGKSVLVLEALTPGAGATGPSSNGSLVLTIQSCSRDRRSANTSARAGSSSRFRPSAGSSHRS